MTSLEHDFRRIGLLLLATVLVIGVVAVLVVATDIVLLIFLGILFGILLIKLSHWLHGFVALSYGWRLFVVTTTLAMGMLLGALLLAAKIEGQLSNLSERLDQSTELVDKWLVEYPTARGVLRGVPVIGEKLLENGGGGIADARGRDAGRGQRPAATSSEDRGGAANTQPDAQKDAEKDGQKDAEQRAQEKAGGEIADAAKALVKPVGGRVFSALQSMIASSLGLIVNVWLVIFIALFVAAGPDVYRKGVAQLFPIDKRERVREVMGMMGDEMFNWLIGRFATMAITGAGTGLALWAIGVPLPLTIGVITGLLAFIPNIGAYASGALAVLVAVPEGGTAVGLVLLAYLGVQIIESYIATPLIQQRLTSIPPALLLGFQFIMGALAGIIGLLVATPLLAAGKVLVRQVWIKDVLGDETVDENN